MARALDWTQYDRLKAEGLADREIARRWDIPWSTFCWEKRRRQEAAADGGPHGRNGSPAAPAPPAPPAAPAPPAMTFVAVPEIQEILHIVKELQTRVASLEQTRVAPALPAPPAAPAPPAPPAAERKEIQQWTLRLSKALIEHLKAIAYERRIPPSQLVEDWLWQKAHEEEAP